MLHMMHTLSIIRHLFSFSEEENQEVKLPLFTTAETFDGQISCRKSQRRGPNS